MTFVLPTILDIPLLIVVLFGLLVLTGAALFVRSKRSWLTRIQSKPLLTPNEREFFTGSNERYLGVAYFRKCSSSVLQELSIITA